MINSAQATGIKRLRSIGTAIPTVALSLFLHLPSSAVAEGTSAPAGCVGKASDTWLIIVAEGMRSNKGLLAITLYADDKRKFLVRHGSIHVGRVDAVAGTQRSCTFLPSPGTYAIALYHDENGNGKIDRKSWGPPKEGYGFSNNASTLFGLPSFKSVRLKVPESGKEIRIRMKYP